MDGSVGGDTEFIDGRSSIFFFLILVQSRYYLQPDCRVVYITT